MLMCLSYCLFMVKKKKKFVADDLLRGTSARESDVQADVFSKSRAPTAV